MISSAIIKILSHTLGAFVSKSGHKFWPEGESAIRTKSLSEKVGIVSPLGVLEGASGASRKTGIFHFFLP